MIQSVAAESLHLCLALQVVGQGHTSWDGERSVAPRKSIMIHWQLHLYGKCMMFLKIYEKFKGKMMDDPWVDVWYLHGNYN